ncbi:4-amino-6-deoxy-N-Acetyl-D-hexosaminyl-(Lipid carrier) acetyltrasferase [hydrothermal vent metagenome]|uniref:4-amino-6-deoxy-N-Acetyl-D-hexosaminyl-(Lipid carrier) acetyltrasferase n=1 Tax=hydrothermal vent metagenome TaxID=652676 RepID=A0A1W1BME9_9ZZZZ
MKPKILLIGGGGHCRSVIDVIEQENRFEIAGIIEKYSGESQAVLDYELIGTDDQLLALREQYEYAFVTIGHISSNNVRVKLFEQLKTIGYKIPTIISPLAYVSKHATIAQGTIVMHHALVNAGAEIGQNCIINSKALVEHDATIKDNVHISTGAIVNGGSIIQANSFYGSNATCKEGSLIAGFIKAGSVAQ